MNVKGHGDVVVVVVIAIVISVIAMVTVMVHVIVIWDHGGVVVMVNIVTFLTKVISCIVHVNGHVMAQRLHTSFAVFGPI